MAPSDKPVPSYILPTLLSPERLGLGTLISSLTSPYQELHRPQIQPDAADIIREPQPSFRSIQHATDQRELRNQLTALLTASYGCESSEDISIESVVATSYFLENSGSFFRSICELEKTKEFLEIQIEGGRPVYLITGYHTVLDAAISHTRSRAHCVSGDVSLPVAEIASAAAGVPGLVPQPLGSLTNVGAGVTVGSRVGTEMQYMAPGERIYALQARKVRFKWYSKKDVDRAFLEKGNRWTEGFGMRGNAPNRGESDADEEILDADLLGDEADDAKEGQGLEQDEGSGSLLQPLKRWNVEYGDDDGDTEEFVLLTV